ncbi:hypothetical protein [Rubeoparvulum massiliense]|nr:hypothetical protein [Rubeoparvulum massiliense]
MFLEHEGWIPVDVSMANTVKRGPWQYLLAEYRTQWSQRYFDL